ncbi:hypothetical protein GQ457_13G016400 [Hibiscus cannabinus]
MSIGTLGMGIGTGKTYRYRLYTLESFGVSWPSDSIGTHKGVPVRYVAYMYSGRVSVQVLDSRILFMCLRSMGIGTGVGIPVRKAKNALQHNDFGIFLVLHESSRDQELARIFEDSKEDQAQRRSRGVVIKKQN